MSKLDLGIKVMGAKFLNRRKPLFVTIRVTNRCNFNCLYCDFYKFKAEDPTTEQIKRCIREFREAGAVKFGFTGGEPLLRSDMGELISYSRSLRLVTTMTSNGWYVAERIDELKDLNVIILSLDGVGEVHDRQRKKGSFVSVLDAVKACREREMTVLALTVLTRHNMEQIDRILELAREHGFQQIFQPVESRDFFREGLDQVTPDPGAFKEAVRRLREAKKRGAPVYNSFAYLKFLESWPKYDLCIPCWAGEISCVVNADGPVLPCNNLTKMNRAVSGFEVGFAKAFEEMGKFRCKGCWTNCYQENNCVMNFSPTAIAAAISRIRRFTKEVS